MSPRPAGKIPPEEVLHIMLNRRRFIQRTSVLAFSTSVLLDRATAQSPNFVTAETTFGKIRGIDNNGIKTFKGIPYGAATAGANRFMPPADPEKWTGLRDALEYGHSAPQRDPAARPPAPGAL